MAQHGPEPGTILNTTGVPTTPRQAATVIVLRGGSERLEVLMVQRTPKARFMGGAWVFPGGAVDAGEGEGDAAHRAAAVREVQEEAGLTLPDPAALVPFARWITPPEVTVRFDTYFFLAPAPAGQEVKPDGQEIVDARWFTPARALEGGEAGDLLLVFPTIKNLERLARFYTADALLEWATRHEVRPVQPRVEGQGEAARIVLEDDE
jgi:8-oxo-dGTP pyrophosphatase MutT (NUDIX family)